MNKNTIRQVLVTVATIVLLVVNYLANALPFGGRTTGEVSDGFDVYFVPAGYVFSIWGLIYLGLIAYTVYQALPAQREAPSLQRIGYLYVASCAANILWLLMWHNLQIPLTVVLMLILLGLLIAIYLSLGIGRVRVPPARRLAVHIPFSIYLGWITVATIANVTDLLYDLGWNGGGIGPQVWAAIMLGAAAAITVAVSLTRRDVAYPGVIVWAAIGIAVKQAGVPLVRTTAWITAGIAALALLAAVYLQIRWRQQEAGAESRQM